MILENKRSITDEILLAREEERITKEKADARWQSGLLDTFPVGTFTGLASIHRHLFSDIYDFAGEVRTVNLAKGNFRFAPVLYLSAALDSISAMPEDSFDAIIEKYVEMNIAHPFREGNGRATRIRLDQILKKRLGQVIDWSTVDKTEYLLVMERSPIRDLEIKYLLKQARTDKIDDRTVFMKGLDASYHYEGYTAYKTEDLSPKE